jgi:hypothetical protein
MEGARPVVLSQELQWNGIPPRCRGRLWPYLIGNDNKVSPELFVMCVARARKLRAWSGASLRPTESWKSDPMVMDAARLGREDTLAVSRCRFRNPCLSL